MEDKLSQTEPYEIINKKKDLKNKFTVTNIILLIWLVFTGINCWNSDYFEERYIYRKFTILV